MMLRLSFLETLFLYCIHKLNGERSIFAIYHLLKGKKSSQTIQDAHLFRMRELFRTYTPIDRELLVKHVTAFLKEEWVIPMKKENHFQLTDKGLVVLRENLQDHPLPADIDGLRYQSISAIFWGRLTLLVQSLSHIIHERNHFYPIQRNASIQNWVKHYFRIHPQDRPEIGEAFFQELVMLLEQKSDAKRNVFVMKLTGAHRVGSTFRQISEAMKMDEVYARFLFLGVIHFILREISLNEKRFPFLYSVIQDLNASIDRPLTDSAKRTLQFLEDGRSLPEIARLRRLKVNTIEDHIVEIVLARPDFRITPFVSEHVAGKIKETVEKANTKQLKIIKNQLDDEDVSFFQIRLVLARAGEE